MIEKLKKDGKKLVMRKSSDIKHTFISMVQNSGLQFEIIDEEKSTERSNTYQEYDQKALDKLVSKAQSIISEIAAVGKISDIDVSVLACQMKSVDELCNKKNVKNTSSQSKLNRSYEVCKKIVDELTDEYMNGIQDDEYAYIEMLCRKTYALSRIVEISLALKCYESIDLQLTIEELLTCLARINCIFHYGGFDARVHAICCQAYALLKVPQRAEEQMEIAEHLIPDLKTEFKLMQRIDKLFGIIALLDSYAEDNRDTLLQTCVSNQNRILHECNKSYKGYDIMSNQIRNQKATLNYFQEENVSDDVVASIFRAGLSFAMIPVAKHILAITLLKYGRSSDMRYVIDLEKEVITEISAKKRDNFPDADSFFQAIDTALAIAYYQKSDTEQGGKYFIKILKKALHDGYGVT